MEHTTGLFKILWSTHTTGQFKFLWSAQLNDWTIHDSMEHTHDWTIQDSMEHTHDYLSFYGAHTRLVVHKSTECYRDVNLILCTRLDYSSFYGARTRLDYSSFYGGTHTTGLFTILWKHRHDWLSIKALSAIGTLISSFAHDWTIHDSMEHAHDWTIQVSMEHTIKRLDYSSFYGVGFFFFSKR